MKKHVVVSMVFGAILASQGAMAVQREGGKEGGGGNSVDGVMIDSLRRYHPKDLPGYQKVVAPIIGKIRERMPEFADDLERHAMAKDWIIFPHRLNEAPASITGLPFDSDQTGRQTKNVVWVGRPDFRSKSMHEKGVFILHEMVLSFFETMDQDAHEKTERLVNKLIDKKFMNETELQDEVQRCVEKYYATASQIAERKRQDAEILAKIAAKMKPECEKIRVVLNGDCKPALPSQVEKKTNVLFLQYACISSWTGGYYLNEDMARWDAEVAVTGSSDAKRSSESQSIHGRLDMLQYSFPTHDLSLDIGAERRQAIFDSLSEVVQTVLNRCDQFEQAVK